MTQTIEYIPPQLPLSSAPKAQPIVMPSYCSTVEVKIKPSKPEDSKPRPAFLSFKVPKTRTTKTKAKPRAFRPEDKPASLCPALNEA